MIVAIIGSGAVAEALAIGISDTDMEFAGVVARNNDRKETIKALCGCQVFDLDNIPKADIYIIATTDTAIESVVDQLDLNGAVVAHTAGGVGIDVLQQTSKDGAVLYPLQSFVKGRKVNWREIPILIEGTTSKALDCVRSVASKLSGNVIETTSEKRAKVHLSAVFASNFTNHCYAVAQKIVDQTGIDRSILSPLIMETARKAIEAERAADVQTGPAIRKDFRTTGMHTELLKDDKILNTLYQNMSNSIWEISKKI